MTFSQIRNKRLAKLGAPSSSANNNDNISHAASPQSAPSDSSKPRPSGSQTDGAPESNPFDKFGMKANESKAPKAINIKQSSATPAKRDSENMPRPKPNPTTQESSGDWEDKTLSNLFRLTLHPEKTKDASSNALYFVEGVRGDLEQENAPLKLTTSLLDQALIEAASNMDKTPPLEYLLACWKRITRLSRSTRVAPQDASKAEVIKEAKRICFNYCMFTITMPDMFGQDTPATSILTQHLLVDPESDRGICHDFLTEAVARFEDDESVKDTMVQAVEHMSLNLSAMTMNDDYRPYVTVSIKRRTACIALREYTFD